MARDSLQYDKMVENALRGVVRQALASVVDQCLPGNHHFYLTFRTNHPDVEIADRLHAQYPQEMTIVLQHQFWGLEVNDEYFVVNLSFSNVPERLKVPYAALVSFVDPSVKFGLQFQVQDGGATVAADKPLPATTIKEAPALALATVDGQAEKKPKDETKARETAAKETAAKEPMARETAPKDTAPVKKPAPAAAEPAASTPEGAADKKDPEKVVSLDAFRKK